MYIFGSSRVPHIHHLAPLEYKGEGVPEIKERRGFRRDRSPPSWYLDYGNANLSLELSSSLSYMYQVRKHNQYPPAFASDTV